MSGWKWLFAVGLTVVGAHTLSNPPGLLGFAATGCNPTGDCASYMAPIFLAIVSIVTGTVLTAMAAVRSLLSRIRSREA